MNFTESLDDRIQELAAGASLGDLTEAEMHEINSYDTKIFLAMVERSEEAAARAFLTFQGKTPTETMPVELRARLKNMANGFLNETTQSENLPLVTSPLTVVAPSNMSLREITAWFCVAASIALGLGVWLPGNTVRTVSMQQQRDALIASAPDLLRTSWEATPSGPTSTKNLGEVIWSSASQQGFMTIQGLPANDATKEQYQLWIIDPTRDDKPVDGGVFNISRTGESVIPIQAKLQVNKPTVFAITVEKPGGVVVSDQKRLPLLAKVAIN